MDAGFELTEEEASRVFKKADSNSDGLICFKDFVTWVTSVRRRKANFNWVDKDGSGSIDLQEWRDAVAAMGWKMSQDAVDKSFRLADTDGDGEISFSEFNKWK